ncbi:unnamed protein product [Heligmosomoides polygyrus]|uniref:Riboflavin transporter n=1 Tax=Heligmosomoides polygyrus TaxID=6339 RepID=A0A183F934_HELPZ|nr:unnamed protein product [Heligmosomoides polygyrus]
MGFSSLIPSLLSLVQGAGKYECEGLVPLFAPPQFSASSFFFVIFVWTVTATVAFEVLCRLDEHKNHKNTDSSALESTPLKESKLKSPESAPLTELEDEQTTEVDVKDPVAASPTISRSSYVVVLIATALVNAQMNGIIPSVQSYAALPYSQGSHMGDLAGVSEGALLQRSGADALRWLTRPNKTVFNVSNVSEHAFTRSWKAKHRAIDAADAGV